MDAPVLVAGGVRAGHHCALARIRSRSRTARCWRATSQAEDDATLSIYLEFAGGTITETRHINKADIAKVVRLTPEQRAAWQAKRDYEGIEKVSVKSERQLSGSTITIGSSATCSTSFSPTTRIPPTRRMSPTRIAQWETERDLVAAGKMKFHGQWLPAAEGARLAEHERGQQLLQQSRWLISQGRLETPSSNLRRSSPCPRNPTLFPKPRRCWPPRFNRTITSLDRQTATIGNRRCFRTTGGGSGTTGGQHGGGIAQSQAPSNGQSLGQPAPLRLLLSSDGGRFAVLRPEPDRR